MVNSPETHQLILQLRPVALRRGGRFAAGPHEAHLARDRLGRCAALELGEGWVSREYIV